MSGTERNPDFPSRRVQANGLNFNVIDVGEGEPVMLVHGFPDTHAVWRKQILALVEAGYRVIAPDTRGCGETDLPDNVPASYTLPTLVDDLRALLDALDLETVKLVGHDWGAVIGWQFVLAHPQRVERYVAMSVGHPNAYARGGIAQKLKGWYVLFFQLRGLAEVLLKAGDWRLFRLLINYTEEWPHLRPILSRPGRLTAGLNYYRANWIRLLIPHKFPHAQVPVIGLFSDGDKYLTERQMRDSGQYCDAGFRYTVVKGANHWMQLHAPDTVNALLLEALCEIGPSAPEDAR